MAYDPKRPRPSVPSEDAPAPVDGLIELTDPPQPPVASTPAEPTDTPAEQTERARDADPVGAPGPAEASPAAGAGVPPALVAALVAAVVALVAIILMRRRRARD